MEGGIFVTGTDTGVGKTFVASLLIRALRAEGVDAVGVKPFACGDRSDADALFAANEGVLEIGVVNPVWLRVPAAPYAASLVENRMLDVEMARDACERVRREHRFVVVEGVGGWRVPLRQDLCMSGFARELGFPVLVVAANRLGALNHTQLTVDAIRASGLAVAGILWNHVSPGEGDPATLTNQEVMEVLLPGVFQAAIDYGAQGFPQGWLAQLRQRLPQRHGW